MNKTIRIIIATLLSLTLFNCSTYTVKNDMSKRGELTKISQISFTGDKKIKDKRLRDIIASEEEKFWKVISRNSRFSENLINLDKRLLVN